MNDQPTEVAKYHPLKYNSTEPRRVPPWTVIRCVSGALVYMLWDTPNKKPLCLVTLEPVSWGSSVYILHEIEGDRELAESLLAGLQ